MNSHTMQTHALIDSIMSEWADKGQVIEGGWQAYVATSGLEKATDSQRKQFRDTFYLGAQHLFTSMISIMDVNAEPTEKDLLRMSLIAEELHGFRKSALGSPETTTTAENQANALGDSTIEAEYKQKMLAIAHVLDEVFNGELQGPARTIGFVLLVFPFNAHEGRANYISNGADRKDIVTLFKEQIKRFEGTPDQHGTA